MISGHLDGWTDWINPLKSPLSPVSYVVKAATSIEEEPGWQQSNPGMYVDLDCRGKVGNALANCRSLRERSAALLAAALKATEEQERLFQENKKLQLDAAAKAQEGLAVVSQTQQAQLVGNTTVKWGIAVLAVSIVGTVVYQKFIKK